MPELERPSETEFCPTAEQLFIALMDLMPPGMAWDTFEDKPPELRDTTIRKFIYGIAETWVKLEDDFCKSLDEWFCATSIVDKDGWAADYGIPDACEIFNTDVCAKVMAPVSMSADDLVASLAQVGFVAEGRWLTGNDLEFPNVRSTFRVVIDSNLSPALLPETIVDFPLESSLGLRVAPDAVCMLEAVVPAHCVINLGVSGSFTPLSLGAALKLWYHADDVPNGAAASWTPHAGSGLTTVLTAAGVAQPVSALHDGFRYVDFDGVDDVMVSSINPALTAYSELIAFTRNDQIAATERTAISAFGGQRQLGSFGSSDPPGAALSATLASVGLASGNVLALDAGDIASYTAAGSQAWVDTVPTGGVAGVDSFHVGPTNVATANDPTFVGTAGNLSPSEYFTFDGADWFAAQAQPAWANTWHKAGATFTVVVMVNLASLAANQFLVCTGTGNEIGLRIYVNTSGSLLLQVYNGAATPTVFAATTSTGVAVGGWVPVGVAVDTVAGVVRGLVGRTVGEAACAYASPSAADATRPLILGSVGTAGTSLAAGTQMMFAAAWNRALSASELQVLADNLYKRTDAVIVPRLRVRAASTPPTLTDAATNAAGLVTLLDSSNVNNLRARVGGNAVPNQPVTGFSPAAGQFKLGGGQGFWKGGIRHAFATDAITPSQRMQLEAWCYWDIGRPDLLPGNHSYRNFRP